MSGLKFPKEETKKKECPTHQAFWEAGKIDAICATSTARLKNITYLVVRIGLYQRNMD